MDFTTLKKQKILITGSGGYLGKNLCTFLRKENIAFDILENASENLYNRQYLNKVLDNKDIVVHLAALNKSDDTHEIIHANVMGTFNLLRILAREEKRTKIKFIFASTFQTYIHENIYGFSKKHAESLLRYYSREFNIQPVILRFSNIYGPESKPFHNSALATFFYLIKHNKQITINGDGEQKRDFLYIDDAVQALIQAMITPLKHKSITLDICTGEKHSLNSVLACIEKIEKKKISVNYNHSKKADDWNIKKNYQKAKKYIKWEPSTNLEEGLQKSIL